MIVTTQAWIALGPALLAIVVAFLFIRIVCPTVPIVVRLNVAGLAALLASIGSLTVWQFVDSYLAYAIHMLAVFPIGLVAAGTALFAFRHSLQVSE